MAERAITNTVEQARTRSSEITSSGHMDRHARLLQVIDQRIRRASGIDHHRSAVAVRQLDQPGNQSTRCSSGGRPVQQ